MTRSNIKVEEPSRTDLGFWRRQFMPPTSRAQLAFDVFFGMVAPVLCFVFDPVVFKSDFDDGLFSSYQGYAYMVSGAEILVLLTWLIWGKQLQPRAGLAGGILMAGALFSGLIGVVILPFTLVGLFLGIGIFGFIPFLTALVYYRNGRQALQLAQNHFPDRAYLGTVALGSLLVLSAPAGVNLIASRFVSASMNEVIHGNPQSADAAVDQIKYVRFLARPEIDKLVSAYAAETEPSRKNELKRRYSRLTGEDLEIRLRILAD